MAWGRAGRADAADLCSAAACGRVLCGMLGCEGLMGYSLIGAPPLEAHLLERL
eukprot:gene7054-58430_t